MARKAGNPNPFVGLAKIPRELMERVDQARVDAQSDDQIDEDYIEALAEDFAFFCAYEAKLIDPDGREVWGALNEPQLAITKYALGELVAGRPLLLLILKPRQEGFSSWVAMLLSWLAFFWDHYQALVMAHDEDATDTLLSKYQTIYERANPDLRPELDRSSRRIGMHYMNGSSIRIATAGTKTVAGKKGRSKTLQAAHFSEAAFYDDAAALCGGIKSAIHLGPWKIVIFETTPNGAAGYFFEQYRAAKAGKTDYKAWFVAWHDIRSNRIAPSPEVLIEWEKWRGAGSEAARIAGGFEVDEDDLITEHGLDCAQWSWWTQTFRNVCDRDPERMKQEYPADDVTCFLSTGRPVFPHRQVTAQRANVWQPQRYSVQAAGPVVTVGKHRDGEFGVWLEPEPHADYIMSGDVCSGSTDMDRSIIWVWRVLGDRLELAAGYLGRPDPDELGDKMAALGKWYNFALAAPESNTYGQETLRALRRAAYPSIYREIAWDRAEGGMQKNRLGIHVSWTNRLALISAAKGLLRQGKLIIHSEELLDEMTTYVFDAANNKPQAMSGKLDDCVSAAIIGAYVFQHDDGQVGHRPRHDGHVVVDRWSRVDELEAPESEESDSLVEELERMGWA